VADPDAAVTDTHALLFHAARSVRMLGKRAAAHFAACEAQQGAVYVPAAVMWEVTLLARIGRITLHRPAREFFDDLFSNPCYQPMDLTPAQIFDVGDLRFTRDPFDGLICAAARALDLPLMTRDELIRASGAVRVLW
jgi:PIN domain nuclease of toxin-antitoxin system